MNTLQDRWSEFERHRPRLFGIAYRMLGSRADAEDVLQDAYLRWHRGASDALRSPEAWLVTTVTRLCIDRLRALRAEREHYVGPWLPEPLIGDAAPAADASAELSSSLSVAFLVVRERRPRVHVTEAARRSVLERFARAIQMQDKGALLQLLAEGASWTSDGGGQARAALKVIYGRERVARFALGALGRHMDQLAFAMTTVNNEPALALRAEGKLFSVITVRTDGARILDVYTVLNPSKLAAPAAGAHT